MAQEDLVGEDLGVQVWDLHQMKCVHTLSGHTKAVLRLQKQGDYLFSVGGPWIRVWQCDSGKCVFRILTSRQAGWIRAISVTPNLEVIVGCQDTTLKMYEIKLDTLKCAELRSQNSIPGSRSPRTDGATARIVQQAAPQAQPAAVKLPCIVQTGRDTPESAIEEGKGAGATGSGAAALDSTNRQNQREITEPTLQGNLDDGHCASIHAVVSNQKYVCTAGGDCMIRVWNRTSLNPQHTMSGHRGPVFALVLLGAIDVLSAHKLQPRSVSCFSGTVVDLIAYAPHACGTAASAPWLCLVGNADYNVGNS
jgi:WD40 repeat protein